MTNADVNATVESQVRAILHTSPINASYEDIAKTCGNPRVFGMAMFQMVVDGLLRQHEHDKVLAVSHFSMTGAGMRKLLSILRGEHLDELLATACALFESLTPDEQKHHRHAQRISFATGNVALGYPTEMRSSIEASARRAAGPCPCTKCGGG